MQKSIGELTADYISTTAAAAIVGVSATTLSAWEQRYGFPAPRFIGQAKWYSKKAIEAWLTSDDRLKPNRSVKFGPDHHNAHPKEFVAQALKLHMEGVTLGRIAQRLGIPKATIQHWVDGSNRSRHPTDVKTRARVAKR